ncbi:hypothetical protein MARINON1_51988 [Marinobacter salarius]|nr:hypothetical protein MARINON1_51988 [Marinobacter salarius]
MAGLARVYEERGRSGAGEGGSDLVADMAGFAHAGHDNTPLARHDDFAGADETVINPVGQSVNGLTLDLDGSEGGFFEGLAGFGVHLASGFEMLMLSSWQKYITSRALAALHDKTFSKTDY